MVIICRKGEGSSGCRVNTGGCATRVLLEMDNVDNVLDVYDGPHPILFCGNHSDARRIKAFSQLYDLELKGNV